ERCRRPANCKLQTVLSLMTDDVMFMVLGREPFGKEAFAAMSQGVRVEGASDIRELKVLGDWAYLRRPAARQCGARAGRLRYSARRGDNGRLRETPTC